MFVCFCLFVFIYLFNIYLFIYLFLLSGRRLQTQTSSVQYPRLISVQLVFSFFILHYFTVYTPTWLKTTTCFCYSIIYLYLPKLERSLNCNILMILLIIIRPRISIAESVGRCMNNTSSIGFYQYCTLCAGSKHVWNCFCQAGTHSL